ncbi:polymorphic toxin-type HINT domain-containing protein [Streptomyces murinus]|uniref:polymorphic toxin-type HINT domain-containing protein n=1 Tax=Streptomyces murinus TaxID=33900 RepID=UPI003F47A45D
MVGTLVQGVTQPALAADDGRGRPAVPHSGKPVPVTQVKAKPRTLMKGPRTPRTAPKSAWPNAATAVVELPATAGKHAASTTVRVKGTPLSLDTRGSAAKKPASGAVEARVLDRAAAKKAAVDGLLISLRLKDEAKRKDEAGTKAEDQVKAGVGAAGRTGRVRAGLDYSGFADAFGGGYASRLTLVQLPACALTTPGEAHCRAGKPVATVNDTEKQTLTAQNVSLSAAAPTLLAAVADTQGAGGDYKATPLSPSATWNTSLNTGDFTWSYDMPVPDVPGGLAPKVGLAYSSGSVDGRTGNTNNQASWAGDGFDLGSGFIERKYKPCADDGVKNADGSKPGDLCWAYDNAFLTFNGKGGELVPNGADSWKLKNDDGTKIDRLTSSDRGNGDNDGEYWRLTDPDGTRYYFGYNRLPNWADGKSTTGSTWTVPVFGNGTGEPCHAAAFADSWCRQAWRWNLDYAVDVHGNAIAYYYNQESNSYGRNLKAKDNTRYVRGGTLDHIEYGLKSSAMYDTKALAKVGFTSAERCLSGTACSDIDKDAAAWYDTPWDLNCESDKDCDNGRFSPAFFTRKRLTQVTAQVWNGSTYSDVDSWALTHRWGMADTDYQLLLDSIQHTGHTATPSITLPKTTFAYTQLVNRLDKTGDGYAPFVKDRLSTVADEAGGQIDVNYSDPACDFGALPTAESNTTRCFPQYIGGSSSDDSELQWFNKYVVTSVTSTDRTGGAPDQVTGYQYLGGAAWHYDDDDGLTKEKFKTWSQWRGYGQVRVRTGGQGGPSAMKTQADTYFLRGMDGDRKGPDGGTKSVTVTLGDGEGDPITDEEPAAAFAYKTVSYSGPDGKILAKTVKRPWHHETAKKTRDWGTVTANFTGTARVKSWTSLDDGAGAKWRTMSAANTYDTVAGRITQADDFGDDSTPDDDQCTRTTYATGTSGSILTLTSRVETVSKACDAQVTRPDDVMSDARTAYDGGAYDTAPTKGDATATAELKDYDGTTAVYLESGATFDSYGRQLTGTDLTADVKVTAAGAITRTERKDGRTTTTERTPATGFVTTVKVTTPPAKADDASTAQTTTTTQDILRGLPLTQTDTNGGATNFAYDALGRSTKVWLADTLTGQTPNYQFTYTIAENQPVVVGVKTLGNNSAQRTSYTLYDGFLRPRQTQDPGPDGGRLLADTFYDERGLVSKEFATYYTAGAPGTVLLKPADALSVETQNRYTYDGLGRQTEAKQTAGNGDGGPVLATTTTSYGGDRTTVIPPTGGTATTTLVDARGRTTELRQHHTPSASSAYDTTRYKYTPRGELSRLTDPAGSVWTYKYDLLGRQKETTDPDKGTTTSTYDDRGQLTTTKDARPDSPALWHGYDNLGRQTELREASATGTLRASWTYDTITNAKGQLAQSTRYDHGNAYTTKVVAYDRLYRPLRTSLSVPAAEGALKGDYLTATTYNSSGTVQGIGYPKAGSLSAATVSYTYEDATLRPVSVSSSQGIKATTSYYLTGKPSQYELSKSGGKKTWVTDTYEWGTQRLESSRVDREDVAGVDQNSTYHYDEAGNVRSVSDVSRDGTDSQCFAYDYLARLTEAWTQNTTGCAATPTGSVLGGPAPYWSSYGYDMVGDRTTETLHDTTGDSGKDTTRTYDYPEAGSPHPHAVSSITTTGPTGTAKDSYGYDETGNTTTRTLSGTTRTNDWDAEGHLAKVTEPGAGGTSTTTEYLYDADGNRLIGRTPTETTLYLGATEITLAKGSTTPKATRYYDLGGGQTAVQTDDGTVSFTLADHHGTAQLAVDSATQKLTQRRTLPFGGTRGTEPATWPGTKGFVGGTDDTKSTGLTHLGAREYDPTTGRFLSVDPILDSTNPQSLNGYSYANGSPLTYTDPDGLRPVTYCETGCKTDSGDTYRDWMEPKSDGTWVYKQSYSSYSYDSSGDLHSVVTTGSDLPATGKLVVYKPYNFTPEKKIARIAASLVFDYAAWKGCVNDPGFSMDCASALGDIPVAKPLKLAKLGKLKKVDEAVEDVFGIKKAEKAGTSCLVSPKHSFLPGTKVLLADGTTKAIEDVQTDDVVQVTDPKNGKTVTKKVVATITTEDDKHFTTLTIATEGGGESTITATDTHPFWVPELKDWVDAGTLKPGRHLRTSAGTHVQITAVAHYTKRQRTYDLTVDDVHTYYVLAGQTPVLVHNSGPGCGSVWIDSNRVPHHFKHAADFGVTAKEGKASKQAFVNALEGFVKDPGNVQIAGTYRGTPARHYVDINTGRHVSVDIESGEMLGAWKSDVTSDQFWYLTMQGKL